MSWKDSRVDNKKISHAHRKAHSIGFSLFFFLFLPFEGIFHFLLSFVVESNGEMKKFMNAFENSCTKVIRWKLIQFLSLSLHLFLVFEWVDITVHDLHDDYVDSVEKFLNKCMKSEAPEIKPRFEFPRNLVTFSERPTSTLVCAAICAFELQLSINFVDFVVASTTFQHSYRALHFIRGY